MVPEPGDFPDQYDERSGRGRWRYIGRLGEGGLCIVHKALDMKAPSSRREVAIKVLRHNALPVHAFELHREAQWSLTHLHCHTDKRFDAACSALFVRYLEDHTGFAEAQGEGAAAFAARRQRFEREDFNWQGLGPLRRPRPYVVMEFLPGEALHFTLRRRITAVKAPAKPSLLRRNREAEAVQGLCIEERDEVVLQLAQACEYLHRFGLVHRDLRPCNLQLYERRTVDDKKICRMKVLDLGVTLAADDDLRQSRSPAVQVFSGRHLTAANGYGWLPWEVRAGAVSSLGGSTDGQNVNFQQPPHSFDAFSFGALWLEVLIGSAATPLILDRLAAGQSLGPLLQEHEAGLATRFTCAGELLGKLLGHARVRPRPTEVLCLLSVGNQEECTAKLDSVLQLAAAGKLEAAAPVVADTLNSIDEGVRVDEACNERTEPGSDNESLVAEEHDGPEDVNAQGAAHDAEAAKEAKLQQRCDGVDAKVSSESSSTAQTATQEKSSGSGRQRISSGKGPRSKASRDSDNMPPPPRPDKVNAKATCKKTEPADSRKMEEDHHTQSAEVVGGQAALKSVRARLQEIRQKKKPPLNDDKETPQRYPESSKSPVKTESVVSDLPPSDACAGAKEEKAGAASGAIDSSLQEAEVPSALAVGGKNCPTVPEADVLATSTLTGVRAPMNIHQREAAERPGLAKNDIDMENPTLPQSELSAASAEAEEPKGSVTARDIEKTPAAEQPAAPVSKNTNEEAATARTSLRADDSGGPVIVATRDAQRSCPTAFRQPRRASHSSATAILNKFRQRITQVKQTPDTQQAAATRKDEATCNQNLALEQHGHACALSPAFSQVETPQPDSTSRRTQPSVPETIRETCDSISQPEAASDAPELDSEDKAPSISGCKTASGDPSQVKHAHESTAAEPSAMTSAATEEIHTSQDAGTTGGHPPDQIASAVPQQPKSTDEDAADKKTGPVQCSEPTNQESGLSEQVPTAPKTKAASKRRDLMASWFAQFHYKRIMAAQLKGRHVEPRRKRAKAENITPAAQHGAAPLCKPEAAVGTKHADTGEPEAPEVPREMSEAKADSKTGAATIKAASGLPEAEEQVQLAVECSGAVEAVSKHASDDNGPGNCSTDRAADAGSKKVIAEGYDAVPADPVMPTAADIIMEQIEEAALAHSDFPSAEAVLSEKTEDSSLKDCDVPISHASTGPAAQKVVKLTKRALPVDDAPQVSPSNVVGAATPTPRVAEDEAATEMEKAETVDSIMEWLATQGVVISDDSQQPTTVHASEPADMSSKSRAAEQPLQLHQQAALAASASGDPEHIKPVPCSGSNRLAELLGAATARKTPSEGEKACGRCPEQTQVSSQSGPAEPSTGMLDGPAPFQRCDLPPPAAAVDLHAWQWQGLLDQHHVQRTMPVALPVEFMANATAMPPQTNAMMHPPSQQQFLVHHPTTQLHPVHATGQHSPFGHMMMGTLMQPLPPGLWCPSQDASYGHMTLHTPSTGAWPHKVAQQASTHAAMLQAEVQKRATTASLSTSHRGSRPQAGKASVTYRYQARSRSPRNQLTASWLWKDYL
eukprot:TRINITY_DN90796_c0_g1_i1.p1 TRINITY_DN90796_c0_g1~~TRINITY_DN90796_c0_g1_i1.p1  ORF type:complete len:1559 (+),score=333.20 TRINITY_DN90796_c0_g1_i1:37-4713(+)